MASNPNVGVNGPYTALPMTANNAAGAAGIMPSAGHYADMQTLMQNLDALSGWLQQNREEFEGLRDGLQRVEGLNGRRHSRSAAPVPTHPQDRNLENGVEPDDESTQTIIALQDQLKQSQTRISELESSLTSFQNLHNLFTTTLTETMRLIRNYTYTQQSYIADLHRHYTRLLQNARYETLEARTTHQKWQESLSTLSESSRLALDAREKEVEAESEEGAGESLRAENRGLRWENRILRRLAGWKAREYTEEEIWEEQELKKLEDEDREREMGRARGGSLGVVERIIT